MITIKHNENDLIAANKTHIMLNECALFDKNYFKFDDDYLNKVVREYKDETFYNMARDFLYPNKTKSLVANSLDKIDRDIKMSSTNLMLLADSKNKPVYYIGNAETKDEPFQLLKIAKRYSDLLENFSTKYYADNGLAIAVVNKNELIAFVQCVTMNYSDDLLFNLVTEINSHRYATSKKARVNE